MAGFFLTRAARADVKEIGRYTQETWGVDQRNRYLGQLDACFQRIGRDPRLGKLAEDVRPGYRRIHEGRHVIYFRCVGDEVEIVRVLHDRMLPENHLR